MAPDSRCGRLRRRVAGYESFLSSNAVFSDEGTSQAILSWTLSNTASLNTATPALGLDIKSIPVNEYAVPPRAKQKAGSRPLVGLHRRHGDLPDLQHDGRRNRDSQQRDLRPAERRAELQRLAVRAGRVRQRQALGRARYCGQRRRSGPRRYCLLRGQPFIGQAGPPGPGGRRGDRSHIPDGGRARERPWRDVVHADR